MSYHSGAHMARLLWVVLLLWAARGAVALVRDARATNVSPGLVSLYEVATVAKNQPDTSAADVPLEERIEALAAQCTELCQKLGEIADSLPDDSEALDEVKKVEGEACASVAYFQQEGLTEEELEKRLQEGKSRQAQWKGILEGAMEELRNEALRRAASQSAEGVTVLSRVTSQVSSLEAVLSSLPTGRVATMK
mmetsp:Transcript_22983/g.42284  ORF Transcript_22983/g.42284 Transcript_22983/m.42284 type:complete len:194 (+) Transcript_22983:11-592(+)